MKYKNVPLSTLVLLMALPLLAASKDPIPKTWPASAYHCKPWELPSTSEDPKSEFACYFDSANWTPWQGEIMKDFLSADVPSFDDNPPRHGWSTEHIISHWAVSYREMFAMEGDCAAGTWLIRERNTSHIPDMLPEMYMNLNTVNCGGTFDLKITRNKQYIQNVERFEEGKPLQPVTSTEDADETKSSLFYGPDTPKQ